MPYYRRLRDLREDSDKSQREIGAVLGMAQPQYIRYEKGDRDVPTEVLDKLADYYGVSVDYLLGRTDDRRPYPPAQK